MGGTRSKTIEILQKAFLTKLPIICYVGGISKERGIEQLIQAMAYVEACLIVAGSISEEYKNKLLQLNGAGKVIFTGYLDRSEVLNLHQHSVVGCCTLLNIPNTYYSLPIKMFEYMAAGLPVLASNFPVWKKVIEKNQCGICVNPEDSVQIAFALNQMLLNKKERETYGKNGRSAVKKVYNWDKESKKLLDFYEKFYREEL